MKALNKFRQRVNKVKDLCGAKRRLDRYLATRGDDRAVFRVDGEPLSLAVLGIFASRLINIPRLLHRSSGRRIREYDRWVRSRIRRDATGCRFVGDGFSIWFPQQGGDEGGEGFTGDLREIVLENAYSRGFPFGGMLPDGAVVLDCGGNIGVFTVWTGSAFPGVRVIAFEPEPVMYRAMCDNVNRNGLSERVQCIQAAVSDRESERELLCDARCATQHKLVETYDASVQEDQRRRAARVEKVKCVTIDRMVEELRIDRCDLIKMDIEGAEPEALRGARATIQRFRPRLSLASYHRPSDTYVLPMMVRDICPEYNVLVNETHLFAFV